MDDIEEPILDEEEEGFIEEYEVEQEVIGDTIEEVDARREEMGMSSEEQERFVQQITFIYETLEESNDVKCYDEFQNALKNQDMESLSEDCMEKVQSAARKHQYISGDKQYQQRQQKGYTPKTPEEIAEDNSIRFQMSIVVAILIGAVGFYIYYVNMQFQGTSAPKKKLSKKKLQKKMQQNKKK